MVVVKLLLTWFPLFGMILGCRQWFFPASCHAAQGAAAGKAPATTPPQWTAPAAPQPTPPARSRA